jgi:predicted dinucleotide-binding enzyme
MNIGIIGAGNIGATAAGLFANAGHRVAISNSRAPESLRDLVAELGPNVETTTVEDAAAFGEVVLVAIPFKDYETRPADQLAGKIVLDAMNYYAQRDGQIDFDDLRSSEVVARRLPRARLVKAFDSMYYEALATAGRKENGDRLVLFIARDMPEAKAVVSRLIEEIGFVPVGIGSSRDGGRKQQPGSPIYNNPMMTDRAREMLGQMG